MYLLGYDIGSSSVKAAIIDAATGECVAADFYPKTEAPILALQEGWAEQEPESWWRYITEATRRVLAAAQVAPADIKAIGISYQMHGLVAIDRQGQVLRNAIIWCDSRGVPYGEKAAADLGPELCLGRLLNLPGNFTATKLAWVQEHEPALFDRIYKVMLPGDYVAWRMTGVLCTTPEGLSEYMLWDFKDNAPAHFMLDYFGYSPSILPDLRPTFSDQGHLTDDAARQLGLCPGTPITYRAGDQPNNALSLNVLNPGDVASTAGTSGVVYGINDHIDYDPRSRVNNFAHVNHSAQAPRIGVMTCISGTGILNSWIKRNMAPTGITYSQINELAAQAPIGSAGLSVLPFGNGAERVLDNRQLGCSFHHINFNIHDRRHLLRAAQEGIVFSLIYGMEIMEGLGMKIERIHAAHANMFLSPIFSQTLASVSGATIELVDTDGAIGAAKGAGIGAGIYANAQAAFGSLQVITTIEPDCNRQPYIEAYLRWKRTLDAALAAPQATEAV